MMYGLFVSLLECSMEPLEPMEIVLFDNKPAAYQYAAERLVENGHVCEEHGGGWSIPGEAEEFDNAQDVVREWANGLSASEYFHVVECREGC